jgi:hypothetical protein
LAVGLERGWDITKMVIRRVPLDREGRGAAGIKRRGGDIRLGEESGGTAEGRASGYGSER